MDKTPQPPTVFDTDQQQLGDVYAKALLAVGNESGSVDLLVDQLGDVSEVVSGLPSFQAALESPRIDASAKVDLVEKAFGGKIDQALMNFLKVLARKNRFSCLAAASRSAVRLRDVAAGRVQAVLTTASEVDDSVRDRIAQRLSKVLGQEVSLTSNVDPAVIGGMVIRVGDTVYDGSVVNQLSQVRRKAVERAANAIREKLDRFASSS
ncbi:MAG: ATP synthase F1 subunit delta [Planctomycetota bacterium]